ncbi:MFS transporter [Pseudomonas sp. CFBP 8771]|uniref:MFS transporter n=1 Tax=Pseudomonas sp. CFBP 8771 TaxID=2775285 RepID=UPI0017811D39|nr:MFS transporter [Pseudomonas sp. CFBP 8771]MBD8602403.1 MFS transporter [Pseudomonas sp. CFBP 8771]
MSNAYRTFFATPGVVALLLAGSMARLPQTMIGLGLITMLVHETGRYWVAGAVAGTFTLTSAILGPMISKLVDQRGQRKVLAPVAAFSIGMLLALIGAVHWHAPLSVLFVLAALAGVLPSFGAMIRARWAYLFRGKPQLHAAYSLDTVLVEFTFIVGPPLSIALSSGLFPQAGPLVAAVLLAVGVVAFLRQHETEPPPVPAVKGPSTSPLRIPALRIIVVAMLALGLLGGSVDVAVVAFAKEQGWPAAASFILAGFAAGSMVAGITFGTVRSGLAYETQLLIGAVFTAVATTLPIFAPNVYWLTGLLFITGMSFAPTLIVVMNIGTKILPPGKITEGLTWLSTGVSVGIAMGGAVAGMVIDHFGTRAGFAVAIGAGLLMLTAVLTGLRTLQATSASEVIVPG